MKKKIWASLIMCMVMIASILTASAAPTQGLITDARTFRQGVNIKGQLDRSYAGKTVTLLLIRNTVTNLDSITIEDTAYINDAVINDFGKWELSFSCRSGFDPAECMVYARVGTEDVTSSVITAVTEDDVIELIDYSVDITQDMAASKATVEVDNVFNVQDDIIEYVPILTFYDDGNRLLKAVVGTRNNPEVEAEIPVGTRYTKAFVWKNTETLIPLCETAEKEKVSDLDVLIIGNSFSVDGSFYAEEIAKAAGVDMNIAVFQLGGYTVKQHWEEKDEEKFNFQYVGGHTVRNVNLEYALAQCDWDIVLLQQWRGADMGEYELQWQPYMNYLAKFVKERCPYASIGLQMVWAFERGYGYSAGNTYEDQLANQKEIWSSLYDWTIRASKEVGSYQYNEDGDTITFGGYPVKIIPSGYAVQYARNYTADNGIKTFDTLWDKALFDVETKHDLGAYQFHVDAAKLINSEEQAAGKVRLNRDGFHMSNEGRYLLGCVWFEALTGKSVLGNTFRPGAVSLDSASSVSAPIFIDYDAVTEENVVLLQRLAHEAVEKYNNGERLP